MFDDYGPYYALAAAYGLTISPKDIGVFTTQIQVTGSFGGCPLYISRVLGRHPRALIRAGLQPGLDLGLSLRPSTIASSVAALLGAVDVEVGEAAFDRAFAVRGDEPERVKALLSAPSLRATLMRCAEAPLEVTDDGATLDYSVGILGTTDDRPMLEGAIRTVVTVVQQMDLARAVTPPPADVARLSASLQLFAHERGLRCAFDSPARIAGTLAGLPVWIAARRRKKGQHDIEIAVRFERPLGFHFSLGTARTGLGTWLQGQDVQVGDFAFDRAFDIYTQAHDRLLPLLDQATRASLLDFGRGRMLRLAPEGLQITDDAGDFDPATLPTLIDGMADLVKTVARRAWGAPVRGYR